jgi:flagellar hook-basal body complex protein FliE
VSIDAIASLAPVAGLAAPVLNAGASPAAPTSGGDFAGQLSASLQHLQDMQTNTDNLAVQAATGQLADVHDYIIAATETNLSTQLAVQVRNKAIDAFNEIMRMQA